jgi:DNA-binding NarL/FixJ family response regulator
MEDEDDEHSHGYDGAGAMKALIVADHTLAAEAIRRELRHAGACEVLGYVDGRRPCAHSVAAARPDVVVIDEMSPQTPLMTRIQEIRAALPDVKILLATVCMDERFLADASAAGVDAAVAKTMHPGSLGVLVREVARGNVFHTFAPAAIERSSDEFGLTARELEILRLVAGGLSNARIAAKLWVTEQTVKFHLSNVYRKLGVGNRTEASHHAHMHGLLGRAPAAPASISVAA